MATIIIPWPVDRCEEGASWQSMAWRIHDHLPYSEPQFFPKLTAFSIGWHENPRQTIYSFAPPRGLLTKPSFNNHTGDHRGEYIGFLAPAEVEEHHTVKCRADVAQPLAGE